MKPEFRRYPDLDALSRAATELVCTLAEEAVRERGLFTVVLAGGKTPKRLYENLQERPVTSACPGLRSTSSGEMSVVCRTITPTAILAWLSVR